MDDRSERKLMGVHSDLVKVLRDAYNAWCLPPLGLIVTEGLRTRERQQELFRAGATKTLNSRHLTGHAIDIAVKVGDNVRWDWPLYEKFGSVMKDCARNLGIAIVWGGDWTTLRDGPHFELDRSKYP